MFLNFQTFTNNVLFADSYPLGASKVIFNKKLKKLKIKKLLCYVYIFLNNLSNSKNRNVLDTLKVIKQISTC